MVIKLVDLCAGIGGMRIGVTEAFKSQQVEVIAACEINKAAAATYEANFGHSPLGDIREMITLPSEPDILMAGFPCQPFSSVGRRQGLTDSRGYLFQEILRLVAVSQPKVILLENVRGLTHLKKGEIFQGMLTDLEKLNYAVCYKLLKSSDFGLPQRRLRVYIVGFHKSLVPRFNDFQFPEPITNILPTTLGSILEENVDINYFLTFNYWDMLKKHKVKQIIKKSGYGFKIIGRHEHANTLLAGNMGRERNLVIDHSPPINSTQTQINPDCVRMLTIRECCRLQGFPESFVIPVLKSQAYIQLGNAVSVPVITALANQIKKVLLSCEE